MSGLLPKSVHVILIFLHFLKTCLIDIHESCVFSDVSSSLGWKVWLALYSYRLTCSLCFLNTVKRSLFWNYLLIKIVLAFLVADMKLHYSIVFSVCLRFMT